MYLHAIIKPNTHVQAGLCDDVPSANKGVGSRLQIEHQFVSLRIELLAAPAILPQAISQVKRLLCVVAGFRIIAYQDKYIYLT